MPNTKKLIAVVGATGQQGNAVVRALLANGQFKVRASDAQSETICSLEKYWRFR